MNALIIIAIVWAIYKLCSSASARSAEREKQETWERIAAEQRRIRDEQNRAVAWQREQERINRENIRKQVEHDKAIARAAKERERIVREQAKQAERIKKHDFMIRDLQYRMKVCEEDHKAVMQRLENLHELYDIESRNIEAADRAGDDAAKAKCLRKIITLDNQIAAAEKKERKIRYDWNTAKQKLA